MKNGRETLSKQGEKTCFPRKSASVVRPGACKPRRVKAFGGREQGWATPNRVANVLARWSGTAKTPRERAMRAKHHCFCVHKWIAAGIPGRVL